MKKSHLFLSVLILLFVQINLWGQTVIPVGASQTYKTIATAYSTGIPSTITGAYIIELQSDYDPSGEGNTTTLTQKTGSSSSNTITIRPASGVSAIEISKTVAAPVIDFSGADWVIIDGRAGGTGTPVLTITNLSTLNTAGTSTIRFINDATNNTVMYCNLKGSSTGGISSGDTYTGVVLFSTSTGTTGNDGNTIDNNYITSSTDANRPTNVIASSGTSGKENSGNTISNNNIYDFLKSGTASQGIYLGNYTTEWTISGNSFYETTSFVSTGGSYYVIKIENTSGNNFTVSGNYIGGSSAQCGGTAWTKTSTSSANYFAGIIIKCGATTASNIQGNTIKNINWTNITSNYFFGIFINTNGKVDVGTTTGNTIGSNTGTGSITVTNGTTASTSLVIGITTSSADEVNCQNNIIGSITTDNSDDRYATNFIGIRLTGSGTTTISNNTIGSTTEPNSINASSPSTTDAQTVIGIYQAGSGTATITGNTISKMKNGTTNTTTTVRGYIHGIFASLGSSNTITNNTVRDLTIANLNTDAGTNRQSIAGIVNTAAGLTQKISGNTIYGLSNTNSNFTAYIQGIYFSGPTAASTSDIYNNFIYGLSSSSTVPLTIIGIHIDNTITAGGEASTIRNIYNNIINLSGDNNYKFYGIHENFTAKRTNNIYFNTVYLSGSPNGNEKSSALNITGGGASTVRNIRNNIFYNARSRTGGTGQHYAAYFINTGVNTIDYNDYFVSGTGGMLAYWGADKSTLALLQAANGQDEHSKNVNPSFPDPDANGTAPEDFKSGNINLKGAGVPISGYDKDYNGFTRPDPPSLGGIENENPLPVTLSSFTSNISGRNVKLNWTTASEINNTGFEVERIRNSEFGIQNWEKIGFVSGKGTVNTPTNYSFEDRNLQTGKYKYRLKQIDANGNFEYFVLNTDVEVGIPTKYNISQNYPNPFNPTTKIDFDLPFNSRVMLIIYDLSGREIKRLLNNEMQAAGFYTITFDGSGISSGIYFYRIAAESGTNKFIETKKMVFLK